MVFIHGGAFIIGTGCFGVHGPQKLMDYDVVLVTINYRIGVLGKSLQSCQNFIGKFVNTYSRLCCFSLGFLNTEDSAASGNYGMLDQVLALRWVKENIVHFGGDPERVTIFGESAGAASVIYHVLSPLSKG